MSKSTDDVSEIDFSEGRRGAVLSSTGKRRITIRIDNDVLDWFRDYAEATGGGSYQWLINQALRDHIAGQREPLESTLRRVLREERALWQAEADEGSPGTAGPPATPS